MARIVILADENLVCFPAFIRMGMRFLRLDAADQFPVRVTAEFVVGMVINILLPSAGDLSRRVPAVVGMPVNLEGVPVFGGGFFLSAGQDVCLAVLCLEMLLFCAGQDFCLNLILGVSLCLSLGGNRDQDRNRIGKEHGKHDCERADSAPQLLSPCPSPHDSFISFRVGPVGAGSLTIPVPPVRFLPLPSKSRRDPPVR